MVIHTFLFKWKSQATAANKQEAAERIRGLQSQIPGIIEATYSENISSRSQGFTHGGVMKFLDLASLEAYFVHPTHQDLVAWLMPLLETAAELDYEV